MKRLKSGSMGWIAITLLVFGWDYGIAIRGKGETLSSAFGRGANHPVVKYPLVLGWFVITAHLFQKLPVEVDPFRRTFRPALINEGISE